jgi:hypothetical protein
MELIVVVIGLATLAVTAVLGGSDSRPRLDDEPHRAI